MINNVFNDALFLLRVQYKHKVAILRLFVLTQKNEFKSTINQILITNMKLYEIMVLMQVLLINRLNGFDHFSILLNWHLLVQSVNYKYKFQWGFDSYLYQAKSTLNWLHIILWISNVFRWLIQTIKISWITTIQISVSVVL